MKKILFRVLLALLVTFSASAETYDANLVTSIEESLNSFKTAEGNFKQYDSEGNMFSGQFWISKPGKMRFNYDNQNYILSDGSFVFYWDNELQQQTNAPLSYTPASIILSDNIQITDDIVINDLKESEDYVEISLSSVENEDYGNLTFRFQKNQESLILKQWKSTSLNGYETLVILNNVKFNVEDMNKQLFHFKNPKKNPFKLN